MLSGHLYVHVLFTEEVKEARHHLDILDLGNKIVLSLSSFRIHQNSKKKTCTTIWAGASPPALTKRGSAPAAIRFEMACSSDRVLLKFFKKKKFSPGMWEHVAGCDTCRRLGEAVSFRKEDPGCLDLLRLAAAVPSLQSGSPWRPLAEVWTCSCSVCLGHRERAPEPQQWVDCYQCYQCYQFYQCTFAFTIILHLCIMR